MKNNKLILNKIKNSKYTKIVAIDNMDLTELPKVVYEHLPALERLSATNNGLSDLRTNIQ